MSERKDETTAIVHGSGNVFHDLGITLTAEDELKIAVAREIVRIINLRGYTQKHVASIFGTDQAKVSQIVRGKLTGHSVERLLKYLLALGINVDVHLSEAHRKRDDGFHAGTVKVHPALAACG